MRKLIFLPFIFTIIINITSCEKENEVIASSLLNKTWFASYEETTPEEIEIYRPGTHDDFPPSRYRQSFYFNVNNVCEYSVLAANDAHYVARGSWEYDEKTKIIRIYNSESEKIYEFTLVELTNQVLKLIAKD